MSARVLLSLCGLGLGLGVALAWAGLRPRPSSLGYPLARYDAGLARSDGHRGEPLGQASYGVLRLLAPRSLAADVAISHSSEARVGLWALFSAATLGLLAALAWAAGAALAPTLASPPLLLVGVVAGMGLGALATLGAVGAAAAGRRREAGAALGTWLDLVHLAVAGGAGVELALRLASEASEHWLYVDLAQALAQAERRHDPAWGALQALATRYRLDSLARVAAKLHLAADEGGATSESLGAMAESLARSEQAAAASAAGKVTERLFLPATVVMAAFLVFVAWPFLSALTSIA